MRKRFIAPNQMRAGERRRFGRPVAVDELGPGEQGERPAHVRHRQHIAAGQHVAHSREDLRTGIDHVIEEPSREPKTVDTLLPDHLPEPVEIGVGVGKHAAGAAVEQGGPELEGRGVERGRRQKQRPHLRTKRRIRLARHEADHGAVRHHDPLGPAGRTGRVHHIGRTLGTDSGCSS